LPALPESDAVTDQNWDRPGNPQPSGWPGAASQPGIGAGWPNFTPGGLPPGFPPQPGIAGAWPPPPPPGGRRRKPLIVTLLAAVAVLAVVGVVMAIVMSTGAKKVGSGSAGDVVKAYLEALAKGDADGALSLGAAQPASRKFLTPEMLKQQISQWPIKNIVIMDDSSKSGGGNDAAVKAAADFGDKHSEGLIMLKKTDGVWKLASATINIATMSEILSTGPATVLTILGKPLGQDSHVYVFPGYLGVKSVPYVDIKVPPLLLESLVGDVATTLNVNYVVNDAGHQAVNRALETWINGCLTAPEKFPKCKPYQSDTPINRSTAKIVGPIDLSGANQMLVPMSLKVMVTGVAHYNMTAQTVSGEMADFKNTLTLATIVDLTKEPPAVGSLR
jgi:hypothetical protein